MNRLSIIKRAHGKVIKPVAPKSPPKRRIRKPPENMEEFRSYRRRVDANFRVKKKAAGRCRACRRDGTHLRYYFDGKLIHEKVAQYCPYHWGNPRVKKVLMASLEGTGEISISAESV